MRIEFRMISILHNQGNLTARMQNPAAPLFCKNSVMRFALVLSVGLAAAQGALSRVISDEDVFDGLADLDGDDVDMLLSSVDAGDFDGVDDEDLVDLLVSYAQEGADDEDEEDDDDAYDEDEDEDEDGEHDSFVDVFPSGGDDDETDGDASADDDDDDAKDAFLSFGGAGEHSCHDLSPCDARYCGVVACATKPAVVATPASVAATPAQPLTAAVAPSTATATSTEAGQVPNSVVASAASMAKPAPLSKVPFTLHALRSRFKYDVSNYANLINIGQNEVLEWRRATGFFQIFAVNRASLDGRTSTPLWRTMERKTFGVWTKIRSDKTVTYMGADTLLVVSRATGQYELYTIDRAVKGNADPLKLKASGLWPEAAGKKFVNLDAGLLLSYAPASAARGDYSTWKLDLASTAMNSSNLSSAYPLKQASNGSDYLFSARNQFAYLGNDTMMVWSGRNYFMMNVNRTDTTFKQVGFGSMAAALGRSSWPAPAWYLRFEYLGANLAIFYRQARRLNGFALFVAPFRLDRTTTQEDLARVAAGRVANMTCVSAGRGEKAAGGVAFKARGTVSRLAGLGKTGSQVVRFGRRLLDLDSATGSYRFLKWSRRSKSFVQKSFGFFPDLKVGTKLHSLGRNRLLALDETTGRFLLYPVRRFRLGTPRASGRIPLKAGYSVHFLGKRVLIANKATGHWRMHRLRRDIRGVDGRLIGRRLAQGKICNLANREFIYLGRRRVLVLHRLTGKYVLLKMHRRPRFQKLGKVLARGTWSEPFVRTTTRLVPFGRRHVMGINADGKGSNTLTWRLDYSDDDKKLSSLRSELRKFKRNVRSLRSLANGRGRNGKASGSEKKLASINDKPRGARLFGGLTARELRHMFKKNLSDLPIKFDYKSTLNEYIRAVKSGEMRAAPSDAAFGLYDLGGSVSALPYGEKAPVEAKPAVPQANKDDAPALADDVMQAASDAPQANPDVSEATFAHPEGKPQLKNPFDDGTGPSDVLLQFEREVDPAMPVGDEHAIGMTDAENQVPETSDAGRVAQEREELEDPIMALEGRVVLPTPSDADQLDVKDDLEAPMVAGDGEPPANYA